MIETTQLVQALEKAVADYQRHFGRPSTIEKLDHMANVRREAQRVMDDVKERMGASTSRAAE